MGSKVIKQKLYEYEVTLKYKEDRIKELQEFLSTEESKVNQLKELVREKEIRIEELQNLVSDNSMRWKASLTREGDYKKEVQRKEKKFKIARSTLNEKKKEIEQLKKIIEHKEHDFQVRWQEREIEMNALINDKDTQLNALGKLLRDREAELELKLELETENRKQIQAKDKVIETLRLVVNEKEQEVAKLGSAFEEKEQELRKKIAEKTAQLAEAISSLHAMEKKLIVIKGRSLWDALRACLMPTHQSNHSVRFFC